MLRTPYASHARAPGTPGALRGMRIGVIRESMVYPAGSKTEEPIVTAAAAEIKAVLGGTLGATLVESSDPAVAPDPDVELMKTDFRRALARLVPVFMPELLFRLRPDGQPVFKEFAAAIEPTEFVPGKVFGSGHDEAGRLLRRAGGRARSRRPRTSTSRRSRSRSSRWRSGSTSRSTSAAARRTGRQRGFAETLVDFAALNARSKFWGDDQRAAFKNWEEVRDMRNPLDRRQGVDERIMLRELLRRVDMMVILENHLDALVRLHTPFPPGKIGGAYQPGLPQQPAPGDVLRAERRADRSAGAGRLRHDGLRPGLRAERRTASATSRRRPTCPRRSRSRACRSRSSSAPSPARRT